MPQATALLLPSPIQRLLLQRFHPHQISLDPALRLCHAWIPLLYRRLGGQNLRIHLILTLLHCLDMTWSRVPPSTAQLVDW